MKAFELDYNHYASLARQASAEGCVLLKNEKKTLPLKKNTKLAVFGRIAFDYYKAGLGSGGLVNTSYVVGILDALQNRNEIQLNESVISEYKIWMKDHPFDHGSGWGQVPWSQVEMPITDRLLDLASDSDVAMIVVGRTAGEDQDSQDEQGSYKLTDLEEDMIEKVCKTFDQVIVVLNVGNIVDMSWVEKYKPSSILYAWHGGQEGGNGLVDVLMANINPSGKLTDTIAYDIHDYPSTENFGDLKQNIYKEDIYVGYRYFETFAKEKVMYPFGFGLSYTDFEISFKSLNKENLLKSVSLSVSVENIGKLDGKEVIQIYLQAPQGKLGKASRELIGFSKTKYLTPGESQEMTIDIPIDYLSSFDDTGASGYLKAYVLEKGDYKFYVGSDVRSALCVDTIYVDETICIEKLSETLAPVVDFKRMKPLINTDNTYDIVYEKVPKKSYKEADLISKNLPQDIDYTGDQGIRLVDVHDGKTSMNHFIAQLSDDDLVHLFRGEGMSSPKVTPGTASAFGGITDPLKALGIPAACAADGPSGIRMDCGTKAFSLPNGTALGCSFNYDLVRALYEVLGMEMRKNKVDTLLGPGMNIHRNPLNGRNFEYISEDPILTGIMSTAQVVGLKNSGVSATIKHFVANNQETGRTTSDSVISERALREIYLKSFEIAVKSGYVNSVMTTYGSVNGLWTSGSYDLNTRILREEWGYKGIVMTDWWAVANHEGENPIKNNRGPMVSAQNDLYMVTADTMASQDNVKTMLDAGQITRGQLQRNAKNILNFIMSSPAMIHFTDRVSPVELIAINKNEENDIILDDIQYLDFEVGQKDLIINFSGANILKSTFVNYSINFKEAGSYEIEMTSVSTLGRLAQLPISIYVNNNLLDTITFKGSEGEAVSEKRSLIHIHTPTTKYIRLYFGADGIHLKDVIIKKS